jgi:hypothetical protein
MDVLRIGTGAGFFADRLDPALDVVARGRLDVIVFESIASAPSPLAIAIVRRYPRPATARS